MRYEPVLNPPGEPVNEEDPDAEYHVDFEGDRELEPLVTDGVPARPSFPSTARNILGGLFTRTTHSSHRNRLAVSPIVSLAPATPISSDGVFANIPAKPGSSRDPLAAEELGEDEWIFMTPEQRMKLAPPVCHSYVGFLWCFKLSSFLRNIPRSNVIGRHDIPLNIPRQRSLSALALSRIAAHQLSGPASTPFLQGLAGSLS